MYRHSTSALPRRRHRGFGLVEVMVGLVIGLIAVLVIYQVFNVAEGFKRNTTAAGEAQSTGLFSTFLLGMELANGGTAMADSAADLATCPDTGNIATSFRPIPVLITDGGGGTVNPNPDSFVVNYSIASTLSSTAMFNYKDPVAKTTTYGPGDPFNIQSAGGFHVGDLIVSINPALPDCRSSKITAVSATGTQTVDLYGTLTDVASVTITHTGTAISYDGDGRPGLSMLFNMGPADRAQKIRYSLNGGVLYSTPLLDANGQPLAVPVGNPLASNVVMMKVEYGIDSDLDALGLLDTWVQANAGGGWDPASMLPGTVTKINQVKAIRIGIIVQSEQFDQTLGNYDWVLFDCSNANKALCPGRLTGTINASAVPPGNWRFKKYETIIPLRNAIWNKS
jgi:type IV pilus assembly protein PilW